MSDLVLPLIVSLTVVVIAALLLPGLISSEKKGGRRRRILSDLQAGGHATDQEVARETAALYGEESLTGSASVDKMLQKVPGLKDIHLLLQRSGMNTPLSTVLIVILAAIFGVGMLLSLRVGTIGFIISTVGIIFLARWYLKRKAEKRIETFINQFPDAVDMIVRSVRSGHPLNAALRMIADNMDPPISTEFRQTINEVAFGRSLNDALRNMSNRINQPDLQFFVVVLAVQQESGGNLGEILSNLSGILRKRKQMRLKIKALTAEGRMTSYILGALPIIVIGALQVTSPDYLTPLFEKTLGNFVLILATGMILMAFFITNRMVKIDI